MINNSVYLDGNFSTGVSTGFYGVSTAYNTDNYSTTLSVSSVYPDVESPANQLLVDGHVNSTGYPLATDEEVLIEQAAVAIIILCLRCAAGSVIVAGNTFNIAIIVKYVRSVNPTHVAIVFLSIGNMLIGGIPFVDVVILAAKIKSKCQIIVFVKELAYSVNVFSIVVIATERCFLIASWKWYKRVWTNEKQVCLCACVMFWSLLVVAVSAFNIESNMRQGSCFVTRTKGNQFVIYVVTILTYIMASAVIVISYFRIIHFLWKHRNSVASLNLSTNQKVGQRKTTSVVGVHFDCISGWYTPSHHLQKHVASEFTLVETGTS